MLVHEMGGSLESWDGVVPALERHFDVIRYDLRGSGLSSVIREPVTIFDLASEAIALLDFLRVNGPVTIAGVAFGGAVAIAAAGYAPERIRALVAINPATDIALAGAQALRDRAGMAERLGMSAIADATLARSFTGSVVDDRARSQYRDRFIAQDAESYAHILRALAAIDLGESIAGVACPTLFVSGSSDVIRPSADVEAASLRIPQSRYQQIESGHLAPVQAPGATGAAILEFARALRIIAGQ
jgi:pimeloyl-ACP methyl ester carboxylesterase